MKRILFICILIVILAFSTSADFPEQGDSYFCAEEGNYSVWKESEGILHSAGRAICSERFRLEKNETEQRFRNIRITILLYISMLWILQSCRKEYWQVLCFTQIRRSDHLLETHLGRFSPVKINN